MLFKHNSKSIQIFENHSNFNSEIVKKNWNIYIFWVIFKIFQMFLCFGLCNIAKQYSSNATYSYINSLFTLDRPLEKPVGHFLSFFCQDQHNCKKVYEETHFFLNIFESLSKVAYFQKNFEELLFILAIHVMLVLGKL